MNKEFYAYFRFNYEAMILALFLRKISLTLNLCLLVEEQMCRVASAPHSDFCPHVLDISSAVPKSRLWYWCGKRIWQIKSLEATLPKGFQFGRNLIKMLISWRGQEGFAWCSGSILAHSPSMNAPASKNISCSTSKLSGYFEESLLLFLLMEISLSA